MGFRYRKSINLGGGFRINLSKSGVGYSWGTKGFRVGKTASGRTRTTYSIPGTGISYVSESGGRKRQGGNQNQRRKQPLPHNNPPTPARQFQPTVDHYRNIESANIENFRSAEFISITSAIEHTIKMNKWGTGLIWCVFLCVLNPGLLVVPLIGIILKIVAHTKGAVHLEYDFDSEKGDEHNRRIGAWIILAEGDKEWQVITETHNTNTKVNAGASRSLNRKTCEIKKGTPFYVKANVDVIQVKLQKEMLLILPDKVFIIRGTKVGAESYDKVQISISSTNFVESNPVPKDAQVIGHTWQYVNKNGTPDRRYSNNKQLPVCLYGVVRLTSPSGINVEIQVSNIQKCRDFDMLIR